MNKLLSNLKKAILLFRAGFSLFIILTPIILYSLFFILPQKALAATVTWDGGSSGSWNTAANTGAITQKIIN